MPDRLNSLQTLYRLIGDWRNNSSKESDKEVRFEVPERETRRPPAH